MEKYFATSTGENGYSIKKVGGNNRLVALIDAGEFHFMVSSGENVEAVKDFCIRKGIWFPYRHEHFGDICFIYEEVLRRTVAVIDENKQIHFLAESELELDVKWYCVKNNLCEMKAFKNVIFNMKDVITDEDTGEVVAIIDNIDEKKYFSFFEWSSADEVDVRLYCKINNLYLE